jgi:glycosyltransferase involved in cell wall biosynthesis
MTKVSPAPSVAVVLCTCNGSRFLPEQLQSILDQTRAPDEMIIVDDASSDDTMALLGEFEAHARQRGIAVSVARNPVNLGYVRNFERATGLARADLVFLCDQDDVWEPTKIERMWQVFQSRPSLLLLHTDARLIDASGADMGYSLFDALEVTANELSAVHAGNAFEALLRRNLVTGAATAFRRELLHDAAPFPDAWVHDEWLAIVAAATGEIDCLEEPLIAYRQHGSNQIGVRRRSVAEKFAGSRSRREHMRSVAARLEKLASYVGQLSVPVRKDAQSLLSQRLLHAKARADLPQDLRRRWRWVFTEARSGRYHRYSFGARSIVADLLGLD